MSSGIERSPWESKHDFKMRKAAVEARVVDQTTASITPVGGGAPAVTPIGEAPRTGFFRRSK